MSDIVRLKDSIVTTEKNDVGTRAKSIYAICKAITPQFYKHTQEEMTVQVTSIAYLIRDIRKDALSAMVELAIERYPKARAESVAYFDISFILSFYNEGWERAHPPEYNCFAGMDENKHLCYTTDDDFDWDNNHAKPNAKIWIDER